jgi:hypothetical protein
MGDMRNAHKILVGKLEESKDLKINIKGTGCEGVG